MSNRKYATWSHETLMALLNAREKTLFKPITVDSDDVMLSMARSLSEEQRIIFSRMIHYVKCLLLLKYTRWNTIFTLSLSCLLCLMMLGMNIQWLMSDWIWFERKRVERKYLVDITCKQEFSRFYHWHHSFHHQTLQLIEWECWLFYIWYKWMPTILSRLPHTEVLVWLKHGSLEFKSQFWLPFLSMEWFWQWRSSGQFKKNSKKLFWEW